MAELVMKYQRYEEYKDSGVEWLDVIPNHWNTVSLKMLIDVRDGTHETPSYVEKSDNSYPLVTSKDVTSGQIDLTDCKYISQQDYESIIKRSAVSKGDILMPMIGTVGSPVLVEEKLEIAIKNLALFRTSESNEKITVKFLHYFLNSKECSMQFSLEGRGGVQNFVSLGTLRSLGLPLITLNEQNQIANFLDHETAQIDTLIEKQQTLIQLLKEKRQAVISHAVTKGLNPDAPMKDSGVEWLGKVPEHWDIVKLKWKASTTSGGTPTTSKYEDYYEDGDIPWIRTTDLNNDKLNETPIMITPKAVRDSACSLLPKNSVLIAMYGGAGSIGKHSLLNFESTINQAVCGVLPSEAFVPDYLHRFYEFYRPFWMIGAAGTRKDPNIGQDNIKEARIPIPPLSEQHQIADYLDKMQSHFGALTESAEKGIQLMQERRTALISAAVTGKIDVRSWRAQE